MEKELNTISENSSNTPILFNPDYEGVNVYAISGDYSVSGDTVSAIVLITKGGTEILYRYEVKGAVTNLNGLVTSITVAAMDWLKKK